MKTYSATDLRKNFSQAYNLVRYGGQVVTVTNHGDDSVIIIRKQDVYPNPETNQLFATAQASGAFDDDQNITYE